jgi:hypothetical protein
VEFNAGDCFLLKNIQGSDPHLHITLCGPAGNPPTVITAIVNTAYDENNDVPVDNRSHNYILEPMVHPFLKVVSVVNFRSVSKLSVDHLKKAEELSSWSGSPMNERLFRPHLPIDVGLLQRIINAGLESKATPKGMKAEIQQRLGIADVP